MKNLFLIALLALSASCVNAQLMRRGLMTSQRPACTMPSLTGAFGAWFADQGVTCTGGCTAGNPVTAIADQGPLANNLTAISNATFRTAEINGLPAVDTLGTAYFQVPAMSQSVPGDTSVIMVAKLNSLTGKQTVTSNQTSAGSFAYYLNYGATNQQGADVDETAAIAGGTAAHDLNYHQTNVIFVNGTSYAFRIDRTSDGAGSTGQMVSGSDGITQIGLDHGSIQPANYRWYALIIFNGAITTIVRNNWETYLNCKTGL